MLQDPQHLTYDFDIQHVLHWLKYVHLQLTLWKNTTLSNNSARDASGKISRAKIFMNNSHL